MSKRIIPNPTQDDRAYNRFWHLDLQGPVDFTELEAEAVILKIYLAWQIFFHRRDRVIWADCDPMITRHGWVRTRLRRIAALVNSAKRVAA